LVNLFLPETFPEKLDKTNPMPTLEDKMQMADNRFNALVYYGISSYSKLIGWFNYMI
jgi:hypothetical protein